MKVFNFPGSVANIASPFLIIPYCLFVGLDMYTTYIGTPDLKYEGNWFIRHFNWKWDEIIPFFSIHAVIASVLFLIACNYIYNYYIKNNLRTGKSFLSELFHNKKLLASFFFLGYLYKNLFYTVYIVISNYLSYIYLFRIDNILSGISTLYINLQLKSTTYFFEIIETIFIIATIFFIIYKGRRIRNKYQTISTGGI